MVFVDGGDYQGAVVDSVYASQEDAEKRAREIAYVEERDVQ